MTKLFISVDASVESPPEEGYYFTNLGEMHWLPSETYPEPLGHIKGHFSFDDGESFNVPDQISVLWWLKEVEDKEDLGTAFYLVSKRLLDES